jgi:serine/threonine-protein kinase RsbW
MFSSRQEPCRQEAEYPDLRPNLGTRRTFRRADEVDAVIEAILGEMAGAGYPRKDLFAVRLALEEALVNAVKHGNRGNPEKEVHVRYGVTEGHVVVEVEDEGSGFDPLAVPDPLADENLDRPCGRGLLLIRTYMTWVRYSPRGNCVTMGKGRSGG